MNNPLRLLPAADYVADAVKTVNSSTHRIYLISTIMNEDESTAELFSAIRQAASRGVEVRIAGDAYTFTEIGGHFRLSSQFSKRLRSVSKLKRSFEKTGAHFVWLGDDTSTLLNGRTHAKWLIVDDTVYSFGGTNLYKAGLEAADYMFKTVDGELAEKLIAEQHRIVSAVKNRHAYPSHKFGDELDTLVVCDGSIPTGVWLQARVVGVLNFIDDGEADYKIVVVPADDRNTGDSIQSLDDLGTRWKQMISEHFSHYKDLKKPGSTLVEGWGDIEAAKKIIAESIECYQG